LRDLCEVVNESFQELENKNFTYLFYPKNLSTSSVHSLSMFVYYTRRLTNHSADNVGRHKSLRTFQHTWPTFVSR